MACGSELMAVAIATPEYAMRATSRTCPCNWFCAPANCPTVAASLGSTPGATLLRRVPLGACPLPSVTWL